MVERVAFAGRAVLFFAGLLLISGPALAQDEPIPVRYQFGLAIAGSPQKAEVIGSYARGCLAGGEQLPANGPYWQAMRLSRNRHWGHPNLIAMIKKLAKDSVTRDGWPGLLVGDLAQPRGGPMMSGHKSHQVGLDADIWLTPMPTRRYTWREREDVSAVSMLKNVLDVNPKVFTPGHVALIRRAASYPEVERIGVNPAIKHALCKAEGGDKPWLAKIQSWAGHHYHMHIRIRCPSGSPTCRKQGRPNGTSCASAEKWYENLKAYLAKPKKKKKKRKKVVKKKKKKVVRTIAWLPKACRRVLAADAMPYYAEPRAPARVVTLPVRRTTRVAGGQ